MGAFLVYSRKSDDNAKVTIKSDDKSDDKIVCEDKVKTYGCIVCMPKLGLLHNTTAPVFTCAPGERTFYRVKVPNPPGSGKG